MINLDRVIDLWSGWMSGAAWQLALLASLVIVLTALLRRHANSKVLYFLWMLVALKAFLPPSLSAPWSVGAWGVRPVVENIIPTETEQEPLEETEGFIPEEIASPHDDGTLGSGETNAPSFRFRENDFPSQFNHRTRYLDNPSWGPYTNETSTERSPLSQNLEIFESGSFLEPEALARNDSTTSPIPLIASVTPESPNKGQAISSIQPEYLKPDNKRPVQNIRFSWAVLLSGIWLAGFLGFYYFVALRCIKLRSIRRSATAATDAYLLDTVRDVAKRIGLKAPPHTYVSSQIGGAFMLSPLQPVLVISHRLAWELEPKQLECILAHEFTHLKRRDLWAEWFQVFGQSLFWFHPFLWYANSRARLEREIICDREALQSLKISPIVFGETLARVAAATTNQKVLAPGFMGKGKKKTEVYRRMEKIMNTRNQFKHSFLHYLLAVLFACIFLPMGLHALDRPASEPTDNTSVATEEESGKAVRFDDFDGKLSLDWEILNEDDTHHSLSKVPGSLTITGRLGSFAYDESNYHNLFFIDSPTTAGQVTQITTCLNDFNPKIPFQQAGLLLWNDEDNYLKIVVQPPSSKNTRIVYMAESNGQRTSLMGFELDGDKENIWLRIVKKGNQYSFSTSTDGDKYTPFRTGTDYHGSAMRNGWLTWGSGHVMKIGLYAQASAALRETYKTPEMDASFDFFKVTALPETISVSQAPLVAAQESKKYSIPASSSGSALSIFPDVKENENKVIFKGKYKHFSRGGTYSTLSEMQLLRAENGSLTAVSTYPNSSWGTVAASGDAKHRFMTYRNGQKKDGKVYWTKYDIQDNKIVTTINSPDKDIEVKEQEVPQGSFYDPNSRPDTYCAANILLLGFNLKEGESREFKAYDMNNDGDGYVGYVNRLSHKGKVIVRVPAGVFEANHLVLTQLTSADTWFKKRATHITEFWVLDNGVIVRVLRHREPYELQLESCSVPEELPGLTSEESAAKKLEEDEEVLIDVLAKPISPDGWSSTGYLLESGQNIHFRSNGLIKLATSYSPTGPEGGQLSYMKTPPLLAPDFKSGSLIGKIGKNGIPFFIGNEKRLKTDSSGVLYVAVNERVGLFYDNSGLFKVAFVRGEVTSIAKAQAVSIAQTAQKSLSQAQPLTPDEAVRITVPAKSVQSDGWNFSGYSVKEGQNLNFRATGSAITYANRSPNGPDGRGAAGTTSPERYIAPAFYEGAMIGKIGTEGKPFLIGKGRQLKAEESGPLFLALNDWKGFHADNTGQYFVDLADGALPDKVNVKQSINKISSKSPDGLTSNATEEIALYYKDAASEVTNFILRTEASFGRSGYWYPENAFEAVTGDERENQIVFFASRMENEAYGRQLCEPLAKSGALWDKRLIPGLKKVAFYDPGTNFDCRPKWMAVAALARLGDESIVPSLIPLVDFGNTNVQMWSRAALVRITDQSFGTDKQAWGKWWNAQDKEPKLTEEDLKPFSISAVSGTTAAASAPVASAELLNTSFEEGTDTTATSWKQQTWTGSSTFGVDDSVAHEGKRSITVSSTSGGDASWIQLLTVEPNATYKASCWIKTEDLKTGTGDGAEIHAMPTNPSGSREIAQSKALSGTNDWTKVGVEFNVGNRRQVYICCQFGGWGNSTGKAWFDDLTMEKIGVGKKPTAIAATLTPVSSALAVPSWAKEYAKPDHVSAFGKGYKYAFLSGDGKDHIAPDYSGFFPNDPEASKELAKLHSFNESKWVDDDDICRTVRKGLKGYQDKSRIMSWFGNKYIWGNRPQNPDAIEIAYHMFGDHSLRYNANYFGLSTVASPKPSAILKMFVDTSMAPGNTAISQTTSRFKWGARGQEKQVAAYLKPYLESKDEDLQAKAKQLLNVFDEQASKAQPITPRDEKTAQENEEAKAKRAAEWKQKQEDFAKMALAKNLDALRTAVRRNEINWPREATLEETGKFLEQMKKLCDDSDSQVRNNVARYVGGHLIWTPMHGKQNTAAMDIVMMLSKDTNRDVRYNSVYFGLSTISSKSDEVIRRLLDMAYSDREWNLFSRIKWGLRSSRTRVGAMLESDMANFVKNPENAISAFEVYSDLMERAPAETPAWVAPMGIAQGKEISFGLLAKDAEVQNDLPAFAQQVRETLSKHERGKIWLQQFYMNKDYKKFIAVIYAPLEDKYVFPEFIKSDGTFHSYGSGSTVLTKNKANSLKSLRMPDLSPIEVDEETGLAKGLKPRSLSDLSGDNTEILAALKKYQEAQEMVEKEANAPSELQLMVDAAKAGDTLTLKAKEYKGAVSIDKALTILGAGKGNTLLSSGVLPEGKRSMIEVTGDGMVTLKDMDFALSGQSEADTVLTITEGKAKVSDCSIKHSSGYGIMIAGSEVEVRSCFITKLPRTGIAVTSSKDGKKPKVLIADCEIKECVHRGITIGSGCDDVIVEKCRISASSWHGIRYDHSAPTIRNNIIFGNDRSGIYASGQTAAKVTGNLFDGNAMSGISCWTGNCDTITGNTFVNNSREALGILGVCGPTVKNNIFAFNNEAVMFSNIREGDDVTAKGLTLNNNLFWNNKENFRIPEWVNAEPYSGKSANNLSKNPKFENPENKNYNLQNDSPARSGKIGTSQHITY